VETLTLPILAVVAGLLSFSSPCCLPLLPGYLSFVSALPVSELGERQARGVTLKASLLFVGGFSLVFTLLGVGASLLGNVFLRNQDTIVRVFGVVIIGLGLSTLGVLRLPFLQRERPGCRGERNGRSRWAWPSPPAGPRASVRCWPPSWPPPR